jgi:hypothetical protein
LSGKGRRAAGLCYIKGTAVPEAASTAESVAEALTPTGWGRYP